ncbi:HAMP domain-containing sensor histidine kinase [Saccharibacillus sp. CPCC 101409]|uniref:sensor histidine kinase n=1 Tax=Saccharibacillus sp. CPCC 101409 TaxID=3058041 RepID=UPI002673EEE2|nr:HAMP domain-containing sensor histidine kinase [Saccharibacillus sp. CPCC 101409]MDO3412244.1 HAMP domain-containing sensor histidine kinase [Saccharibacillus sp. CPCC 101409]
MKKAGIVLKLFLVTSLVMLGILTLILLAQSLFFERFYRTVKVNDLVRHMQTFGQEYTEVRTDPVSSARVLGRFANENGAALAILNDNMERRSFDPYFITLQSEGRSVTLLLSSEGTAAADVPSGLQTGDPLTADGIYMDEKDTLMQPVTLQPETEKPEQGLTRVQGEITEMVLPENQAINPFYTQTRLDEALRDWRAEQTGTGDVSAGTAALRGEWTDKWSGVVYARVIVPLQKPDGQTIGYAFALSSLQPLGEATVMLRRYFLYLAPAAAGVLLLLSFVYSRLLSRPLVRLSRTSARMAALDFTPDEGRAIRSRDEFGELSRNLDALGHNLDAALRGLSEANTGLARQMEEKVRAEELRKELIANISHELKTPLGIVKGFAEGLQDDVAADKRERYLQLIVGETDRMNALILDMLQLSRFEAKAIKLKPEAVDIAGHVRSLLDSFAAQLEARNLSAGIQGEQKLLAIADPRRIDQVLLNLLSNAVRHAGEGGEILITLNRIGQGTAEIIVENDGPPIPENELERIWEQFYRAERSRDRKSGGTGLGLAIVRHILELHGSEYGAANTEKGVAFRFTLREAASDNGERKDNE